ncbi:hypothetical protein EI613_17230 [Azospirillum sp. 412522]|nr:glycosyltransferase [Azospirillum sp. 412522]MBY6263643.1 hypothetical protein [Azospirillum sp. 412522]
MTFNSTAVPASAEGLPETLSGFRNRHVGSTVVVCGCGESLSGFTAPEHFITIGVNDVGRLFQPDYLVVVNHRNQFRGDRFRHVESSQAQALFSHLQLGVPHPRQVRFTLGRKGGTELESPDSLPYTRNSPYIAVCLALHMGARRVGLIGVDFTDHHFFAATGKHPLTRELQQIDAEYGKLAQAWRARGVEIVNLSPVSRLRQLPKSSLATFGAARESAAPAKPAIVVQAPSPVTVTPFRLFVVNYRFLSAGDVFTWGLEEAARFLGLSAEQAYWDDPRLEARIAAFDPDLVLVVHGRRFAGRGCRLPPGTKSAVWLVDEPYEVDDTASWSNRFHAVFVNDAATLSRHRNAHYLPVSFDPSRHFDDGGGRPHKVGFIGGHNSVREAMLLRLLDEDLLSYVVGGPWRSPRLKAICLSENIPAEETADLYRRTRIVINIFREKHHFNRARTPGHAMNPRIYEALACGALVVSEHRPEIDTVFPAMPVFRNPDQLVDAVRRLLRDEAAFGVALAACRAALPGHSYADRLRSVIAALGFPLPPTAPTAETVPPALAAARAPLPLPAPANAPVPAQLPPGWGATAGTFALEEPGGGLALRVPHRLPPGAEDGLVSRDAYTAVRLECRVTLAPGSRFIAKLHQQSRLDQTSNSYHLVLENGHGVVATHNRVLHRLAPLSGTMVDVRLDWNDGILRGAVGGQALPAIPAAALTEGYCFVGLNEGTATVRDLTLRSLAPPSVTAAEASPGETEIVLFRGASAPVEGFDVGDGSDGGATLASRAAFADVELRMGVTLEPGATLVVKLHLQERNNPDSNSYHAVFRPQQAYLARHDHVLSALPAPLGAKRALLFRRAGDRIQLFLDNRCVVHARDAELRHGHVSVTVENGSAKLDGLTLSVPDAAAVTAARALPLVTQTTALAHPRPRRATHFAGGRREPPLVPFTATPKRNLIYHIWPVRDSLWRWNLEQLLHRIELFNGRRIVGIASDARADTPAEVQAMLEGHGCEFIVRPNRPTGEVETFPIMLRSLRSEEPNEVTFYGHAKGVKYREAIPPQVRRWTEVLYRTTLDNWGGVRTALDHHVMAGSFRRLGRIAPHRFLGDWHYSGTFFWMRNAHVCDPRLLNVANFYSGVEVWPGQHFPLEKAACLFLDRLVPVPYDADFWTAVGNPALQKWEAACRDVPPPPGLFGERAADGQDGPKLGWLPEELDWLLRRILEQAPARVLTFGSPHGGFEWHLARLARAEGRSLEIVAVSESADPDLDRRLAEAASRFRQSIRRLRRDPADPDLRGELAGGFDAAVLDGMPGYRRARASYDLAGLLGARLIAMNAIVDSDWHAQRGCCHSRLWAEVAPNGRSERCGSNGWGGVGVIAV